MLFFRIRHLIGLLRMKWAVYGEILITGKVLDARRRGTTTEAYEQYAARRSDREQRRSSIAGCED
jgi:hypothetical protein